MRILIVTQCFWPDIYAVNDITRILVGRGHQVSVLTGLPDYTTSRVPKEYKHGKNRHQIYEGAEVFRVPIIARRHGPIWRSLNYLSFVVSGTRAVRRMKLPEFDVIYVWEVSPVTMAFPAIAAKKKYKKKLFLYCMDIWPECIKAMGFREGSLFYKAVHHISRRAYRQCDHIAVSSEPFFEYLESVNGISRKKMSYLPQFASSDLLDRDFRHEYDGTAHFLYIGNVGQAQDMPCLVRAIAALKDRDDVRFHIIGGGSALEDTKALARETGADRVMKFYGPMPFAEAAEYYAKADACILTLDGSNRIGDTLPGKVQTYMAAGKPVIGAMNGAGQQVIRESGAGIVVGAGDSGALADAFSEFADHPDKYGGCGDRARAYFREHFTEEKHFERLESILSGLMG